MALNRFSLSRKTIIIALHDILIIVLSLYAAFLLRFNSIQQSFEILEKPFLFFSIVISAQVLTLVILKPYKHIWRFFSINDLFIIFKFSIIAAVLPLVVLFFFRNLENAPRSIFLIDSALLFFFMLFSRITYRYILTTSKTTSSSIVPIVVLGAGEAAERFIQECNSPSSDLKYQIIAVLDDDPLKKGRSIQGYTIKGRISELLSIANNVQVDYAIICIPSAQTKDIKQILKIAVDSQVKVKTLPKYQDILDTNYSNQVKNIDIDDLLGRASIKIEDQAYYTGITQQKIMITGGGGSIGSEIVRQLCNYKPSEIIVVDFCEFFLHELQTELSRSQNSIQIKYELADVKDKELVNHIFDKHRPDIVFHAAAYKHVPIMEEYPIEAIKTNVRGTLNLLQASSKYEVLKFTLISTDKAINPTNVMGTSKRVAEMLCTYYNTLPNIKTKFVLVRFGNVLGSNGSVIPLFQKQLSEGGPITVTHPDIERYFMSIPEASRLVILSSCLSDRGEIFILDMGEPIKIVQLAKNLILLSGYKEDQIDIEFTGLRPGEKLFEELFSSQEKTQSASPHPKIQIALARELPSTFTQDLNSLLELNCSSSKDDIIKRLQKLVPDFTPKQG